MTTLVDENWDVLLSAFPSGWQELGRETGAIKHQLKEFRSESDLLMVRLLRNRVKPVVSGDYILVLLCPSFGVIISSSIQQKAWGQAKRLPNIR